MNNDTDWFGPALILGTIIIFGMFLFGSSHGYKVGRVETIKYCIEKPADCKLEYDYLKLQEKNK
jgi:hypothetical protein